MLADLEETKQILPDSRNGTWIREKLQLRETNKESALDYDFLSDKIGNC